MACRHLAVNSSSATAGNSVLLGINKGAKFSVPSLFCFENVSNNLKEVGIRVCIAVSVKAILFPPSVKAIVAYPDF